MIRNHTKRKNEKKKQTMVDENSMKLFIFLKSE